jgi:hypothetical protein
MLKMLLVCFCFYNVHNDYLMTLIMSNFLIITWTLRPE